MPKKYLERDYLEKSAIAYNEVSTAIYNKIKAQVNEQKLQKLQEDLGDKISKNEDKLAEAIAKRYKMSKDSALGYILKMKEIIDKTGDQAQAQKYLAEQLKTTEHNLKGLGAFYVRFLISYEEFSRKFKQITNDTFKTANTSFADYGRELSVFRERATNEINKFTNQLKNSKTADEYAANIIRIGRAYNRAIKEVSEQPVSEQRNVLLEQLKDEQKSFLDLYKERSIMANRMIALSKEFGISSSILMSFLRTENESSDEWGNKVLETIELREKQVERYNKAADSEKTNIIANIDTYNKETKALERLAKIYGYTKDTKNTAFSSKNPLLEALKEEIKLILS